MVEKGFNQLGSLWGWGLHYYAGTTGQGHALEYTTDEWYELISRADRIGTLIEQHWAAMGESDPQHRVKIALDEWGAWHNQHPSLPAGYLFGYPGTMRDALVAALSLDTFNRHADKIAMANVAQLVNTIHSLFVAYEDKFVATPNFHVFEMYVPHQGAQAVRTVFASPGLSFKRAITEPPAQAVANMTPQQRAALAQSQAAPGQLWGLQGSASLSGNTLTLTVVNPHAAEARETEVVVRGRPVRSAEGLVLAADDIHAHNSFERPRALEPARAAVDLRDGRLLHRFPPASVTRLQFSLQ
jgi:alpha-L-arabinofuranosidase